MTLPESKRKGTSASKDHAGGDVDILWNPDLDLKMNLCLTIFLVPEPLLIQKDQERTKRTWHEHSSGKWIPVKDLKITLQE